MMDEARTLLTDRAVQAYFLILGWAVRSCLSNYYDHHKNRAADSSTDVEPSNRRVREGCSSHVPPALSALIVIVTWFYILRFILANLRTSESYFDDAYKDVLRTEGYYFTSTQLLTWAIVAVVWTAEVRGGLEILVFGFLGAMSAAFALWVPTLYATGADAGGNRNHGGSGGGCSSRSSSERSSSGGCSTTVRRTVPISYVLSSLIAFISILNLRPCSPGDECIPDAGFGSFRPSFRHWLQTLHVVLILPVFISRPWATQPNVDAALLYGVLAATFAWWHLAQLFGVGTDAVGVFGLGGGCTILTVPRTDCQLSITTDLVCCSAITLYSVYREAEQSETRRRRRECADSAATAAALGRLSVAVFLVPLISPAAVLAAHRCLTCLPASHGAWISYVQRCVAARLRREDEEKKGADGEDSAALRKDAGGNDTSKPKWCNLGLWDTDKGDGKEGEGGKLCTSCTYDEACENLARALGEAADLNPADAVLSCGCGSEGRTELTYYKETFGLRHITGIDPNLINEDVGRGTLTLLRDDFNIRTIRAGVEDLSQGGSGADRGGGGTGATVTGPSLLFPPGFFDKIIALDNVYHYACKHAFFVDGARLLPPGGKIVVSDILLVTSEDDDSDGTPTPTTPLWVKVVLRAIGVPSCNLWTENEYRRRLVSVGFEEVEVKRIGRRVFGGWSRFLPQGLMKYLDYAIIVATSSPPSSFSSVAGKNDRQQRRRQKKRVAIVGSGLAGLSASHTIATSSKAAEISIDIYESHSRPGLAGNTTLIGNQMVDVPARMAAEGYYTQYGQLLDSLGIPTVVVRTDCSYYGADGAGGNVVHSYDKRSVVNIYNAFFIGGVRKLWQLFGAMSNIDKENDPNADDCGGGEHSLTFGDWLQKHFGLYPAGVASKVGVQNGSGKQHSEFDLPSLTCRDSPFAYILIGSLSWMLSCTYEQLVEYPADIILPYCRGLNMSRLGLFRRGQVVRINPTIKALEQALLYGTNKLQCGTRVEGVDERKIVNGVEYDAIICATEARAVPKVVKDSSEVFSKIGYHPSTIYLHTDESFMPPNKKDWKCWNVEMSAGRSEPQLTFWLNEFYPNAEFDGNVFQTWAPTHRPKEELIIEKCDFERVVHTYNTKELVAAINQEQGKRGIYYAGSYCVYGMGLLEQALVSGKNAGEKVLDGLFEVADEITS